MGRGRGLGVKLLATEDRAAASHLNPPFGMKNRAMLR